MLEAGTLEADASQERALAELDRLHSELVDADASRLSGWLRAFLPGTNRKQPRGCYLWGGVGTGKTLLMDLFAASLPAGMSERTHFHRFMRSIHAQKNLVKDESDPLKRVARDIAGRHRVFCLDEFTVSDIADAMIMSTLLSRLLERGVTLVTTSNTPPKNLYQGGLQRDRFLPAIELIESHATVVRVDSGNDYRMAFLSGTDTFLVPATPNSRARLESAFLHLAGPNPVFDARLEVNGRHICAVALGADTVWFTFPAICQSHRSNSDFIEIARQFHTVIISEIPELGPDMDDAARRFIELVDELYDRNVNLLASSQQHPNEIYRGKRLAGAFLRTASRLVEMASEAYLSTPHR